MINEFSKLPGSAQFDDYKKSEQLFIDWMRSTKFSLVHATQYKGKGPHINISELWSALDAERAIDANEDPGSPGLIIGDSSVAGCCAVKGRSSSSMLNAPLQHHVPTVTLRVIPPETQLKVRWRSSALSCRRRS